MAIAAPEAILDGGALLAVAGCLLMLGLLYAVKGFVTAAFSPLNVKIPLVGRPFSSIVQAVENNILNWIDKAIVADQVAIAHLLSGITWLFDQSVGAMEDIVTNTDAAFKHLVTATIPAIAHDAANDAIHIANTASGGLTTIRNDLTADVQKLTNSVADAIGKAEDYTDSQVHTLRNLLESEITKAITTAEQSSGALIGSSIDFLSRRIDNLGSSSVTITANDIANIAQRVTPIVENAIGSVGGAVGETDAEVRSAISTAITESLAAGGTIENAIQSSIAAAIAHLPPTVITGAGDVTGQIANYIGAALSLGGDIDNDIRSVVNGAVAAAIAGVHLPPIDIGGALQPIEDIINDIRNVSLPQLAAATAVVATTVSVLESEAGLGDPACRAKNKQICGTDALHWGQFLAGLVSVAALLDFPELVKICQDGFNDAESVVESLT